MAFPLIGFAWSVRGSMNLAELESVWKTGLRTIRESNSWCVVNRPVALIESERPHNNENRWCSRWIPAGWVLGFSKANSSF